MQDQLKPSSRLVDFQSILDYAALTNDYNPLHVDKAFAAKTPFGDVIAHGTMSVALIWQALAQTLGKQALDGIAVEIRFMKPVRVGQTVAGGGQLRAGSQTVYDVWVKTENGQGDVVISGTATLGAAR